MEYNHQWVEKKWQKYWEDNKVYRAIDFSSKPKYYTLVEFPYPSGVGMHVGHIRAYLALDVIARKRRVEGYNVLFPIGFDAFGLPTENFAIKNKKNPRTVTDENIASFLKQLKEVGFSFDYDRTVDTTDVEFYRWTQWIFLKLYEKGMAYKSKTLVNFCPECQVILANEESQDGKCDRCESEVIQLEKDVWFLRISEYAEKLLETLPELNFLPRIKIEQENWIGKSTGAYIDFKLNVGDENLKIFTTRPDTIFGVTFMVLAPEHPILEKWKQRIENQEEIENYINEAHKKTEFERVHLNKEKSGVLVKGINAIHPITKKEIPLFISDYVMIGYGSGAIMAVPAHDSRDFEFAKKFGLSIIPIIAGKEVAVEANTDTGDGFMCNSEFLDGKSVKDATLAILQYLTDKKIGQKAVNYKMKDWAFNRQRYWGEPIPIINCKKCGEVAVPYSDLPVVLPPLKEIILTTTGESPLANVEEFVNCTCPKCGEKAKRETDTMPQWAGSSWYYLRYLDPHNTKEFADWDKMKYWLPVDWYSGGMEHVTRHLIYSRFWHRFLYDQGLVTTIEPFQKRTLQGLFLDQDGEKMSKSKGNVVYSHDLIEEYGADALRVWLLFIGDYEQSTPYNSNGIKGTKRFLERIWRLNEMLIDGDGNSDELEVLMNQTIKKVTEDYENLKFNTAIAALMNLVNVIYQKQGLTKKDYFTIIQLIHPIAPHISEELRELFFKNNDLITMGWPKYDEAKLVSEEILIVIQVNGKVRDKMMIDASLDDDSIKKLVLSNPKIMEYIGDQKINKFIIIPKRLINIVCE